MKTLRDIPEVAGLDGGAGLVRIPPELDIPVTPRARRILDSAAYRRLARISQLGLVSLVYPAALHTRLEHSLGVYRLALLFLRRLSYDSRFAGAIDVANGERFLVAALVHDVGHWPFCHPIEDIRLPDVPSHEHLARGYLQESELAEAVRDGWGIEAADVLSLLTAKERDAPGHILASLLSGPIDIDKMDYLFRDSLHAGVPYGRNFDQPRLISSLCLNAAGDALAITDKGKTAAELMVFARYVMFSEVYWHHAVRSATAMLQRAFYLVYAKLELESLFRKTESEWIAAVTQAAGSSPAGDLLSGLFGPRRRLYKRLAQYSFFQQREIYERLARRPYPWLVQCAERFAERASAVLGTPVAAHEVLFDAPPVEREVEFDIDVYFAKEDRYRPLGEVSPVVEALARRQFDDYVKRVRIFVHPRIADSMRGLAVREILEQVIDDVGR